MAEGTSWDVAGTAWRCGCWSVDRRGDEIADIAYDGRVVLRSIRAVVRDADWNTPNMIVGSPETGERMLRIPLRSSGYGSDLRGEVILEVDGPRLAVTLEAVSAIDFATNRTGLVVLHPPSTAGAALRVEHPDGTAEDARFPVAISPHQPVRDIVGLEWVADGLDVRVAFAGDVFEMEDQRNWTDASFKTYSRPLDLPFPYTLAAGEQVRQRVEVRVRAVSRDESAAPDRDRVTLTTGGDFPAVGVSASTAPDPAPLGTASPGRELVVDLDGAAPNWSAALERAARSGLPLDVRIVDGEGGDLAAVVAALATHDVARVSVFHPDRHVSDAASVARLRAALAGARVDVVVGGGSRSHFTELNREHVELSRDLDEIVTTVTPLFHAVSSAQLIESVAMQRLVATQTVEMAGGRPVRLGPIALRPRFNNVATAAQPGPDRPDLAEGYGAAFTAVDDARQSSAELASWTIASAAALAVPGVVGLAYFEEWGPRGIRRADGAPFPVAAALDELHALAGGTLLHGASPDGLVWALGARIEGRDVVLAANLDARARRVRVVTPAGEATISLGAREWARAAIEA